MAVTDTKITDWKEDYTGADTNLPSQPTALVDYDVDDCMRVIKSVVRMEQYYGEFIRPGIGTGLPYAVNRLSSTQFETDYSSSAFSYGRVVGVVSGGVFTPRVIGSIAFGGIGTIVTVAPNITGNTLPSTIDELFIGAFRPEGGSMIWQAHGSIALPPTGNGIGSIFTCPLDRKMPSVNYYASVQVIAPGAGAAVADALTVRVVERRRDAVDFIRFADATGTIANVLAVLQSY